VEEDSLRDSGAQEATLQCSMHQTIRCSMDWTLTI